MSSLQYSLPCSAAAAATTTTISSQPRSFSKPSQFITTHEKRSIKVSCQNQNDGSSSGQQRKIDRRNMLLGLGGLYGASNLISTPGQASASPIEPDLDSCHRGKNWNDNNQQLKDFCCLGDETQKVFPYDLPTTGATRVRRPAHLLKPYEIERYNEAMQIMRGLPNDHPHSLEQQAKIHCAYCNAAYYQTGTDEVELQVHHNWLFFPFHRWYLYFFERILGKLIDDPSFALPYWNWDHPEGMPVPPMFLNPSSSLYDDIRDPETTIDNPSRPAVLGGDASEADPEKVVKNNIAVMNNEMMTNFPSPTDFMGVKYRKGDPWSTKGEGALEHGSHNMLHWWIGQKKDKPEGNTGENMGNFYSAGRDPLFYSHHSNVDRMWTIWETLPTTTVKKFDDPDFLETQFIFFDEDARLVEVTVQNCLDTIKMGYKYEPRPIDQWKYYIPPLEVIPRSKRSLSAEKLETVLPLTLNRIVRVEVPKSKRGKADELLVIENMTVDTSSFVKFDVFVNDQGSSANNLQKPSYAGTFSLVPSKTASNIATTSTSFVLTDLYKKVDVPDDADKVVVTLVPRNEGDKITIGIGGIKIIETPKNS